MLKIGITGNIACGKSTVDAMLHELAGATIIDADKVTHALLRDDPGLRERVVTAFGIGILDPVGRIDRKALGRIAFSGPAELRRLEEIVHPAVRQAIRAELAALPDESTVVIDAVKLLTGELGSLVHTVWWVIARPEQQLERLMVARGLSAEDARSRIAAQPSLDLYRGFVQVIIDNSGSLAETRNQVILALDTIRCRVRPQGLPLASSEE